MKNKTQTKKIVMLILSIIVIISTLILPTYASYTDVGIPQNRYLAGCWTPSPRYQATWTDEADTSFFGADLDNTYYANDTGTIYGYDNSLIYQTDNDEMEVYYDIANNRKYMTIEPSYNMRYGTTGPISEVTYELSSLANTTKYIDNTWLDTFLPQITMYSKNGNTEFNERDELWSCEIEVIAITETESGTVKTIETTPLRATTRQGLKEKILDPFSIYPNMEVPYEIIGIRNLKWTISADIYSDTTDNDNPYDIVIEYGATITGTIYNGWDFIRQAGTNGVIKGTETVTETIYNNRLDITGFMETVRGVVDVNIIGTMSILDMLTIVVGIGITIWFLKMFAGG